MIRQLSKLSLTSTRARSSLFPDQDVQDIQDMDLRTQTPHYNSSLSPVAPTTVSGAVTLLSLRASKTSNARSTKRSLTSALEPILPGYPKYRYLLSHYFYPSNIHSLFPLSAPHSNTITLKQLPSITELDVMCRADGGTSTTTGKATRSAMQNWGSM